MNQSSRRLRIAVLFGGRSSEHDVSVMSATNVMRALDPDRYDAVPVFITRDGRWLLSRYADGALATPEAGTALGLMPGGRGRLLALDDSGAPRALPPVDAVFPVLHGLGGEDGSVQGLAEVARVPLVGCGILGSAVALDKDVAKRLLQAAGVPVARGVTIHAGSPPGFDAVVQTLGLPIFIKPARQGSSVGVSKVTTREDFEAALAEGFRHDTKLVAEEFIQGREIEYAVLDDADRGTVVSRPGEIMPASHHGFYSYDAKYVDADGAALSVPADVPPNVEAAMGAVAVEAFRALGCDGMARVDFFLQPDMRFVINELNTIPGFTDISMYPKAMAASGIGYAALIDRLIAFGLARAERRT